MAYPGLCLGYFIFHRFFIIHPSRKITRTPADLGLKYEEVFFPAAKQVRLQGWYIPSTLSKSAWQQQPVVLFFPGNEGTLSKFLEQMPPLLTAGLDVFMFSYRGFGKSSWRWPFESGLRQDALGAWNYLTQTRGLQPSQIIFYAQSLGCGLAAWAAAQCQPSALILEGGFPSVVDVTAHLVPWLPVRFLTTQRFDTRQNLGRVSCPVLIAHSQDDRAIPFFYSQQLMAAAPAPKSFFALRGEHAQGLLVMPKEYVQAITDLLKKA
jgi:uncharacterized protein